MSFPTDHPVSIQGGTFYNVAGNMNIFSSVSRLSRSRNLSSRESEAIEGRKKPYSRPAKSSHLPDRRFIEDTTPPLYFSGALNSVGDNATRVNLISHGENGLDLLYRSVLQDAMHNSAERPPEPSCHEGTRDRVLSDLRAWSQDDRREGGLLWLYGSAGMGKSAVSQNFAANCQKEGILGASFFFKRQDVGRGTWKGLFPTLAYQLATTFEELRGSIHEAVEDDRLIFGQAMLHQFRKLLVVPLNQAPPLTLHPIIVIDGLDECEDRGVQVQLLKLIIDELRTGRLPVRFLIASRPEAHLREVLQTPDNFDFCRHIELRPDESAYTDIRRYFCDEFSRIRYLHHSRGISLEDDWPGQDSINHLVGKSSGTFIYATTVLRYIDDEYSHPADRLDAVLRLDSHSTAPLDNLYTQILSAIPERSTLRRVLHAVVRTQLDPEEIDAALQLRTGTSRLVLRGLHSVVRAPPVRTIRFRYPVELLHASLSDFLLDPLRSLELCVAAPDLDSQLVHCMAAFLSTTLSGGLCFRVIAVRLILFIVEVKPADSLLLVLQNMDVQQVLFSLFEPYSPSPMVQWLQTFSPLPSDLITVWEDLWFIRQFHPMSQPQHSLSDNFGVTYDDMYIKILSRNSQALLILRMVSIWPANSDPWGAALDLLELQWNELRPLAALRSYWSNGMSLSQSLFTFLHDPIRSRALYASRQEIYDLATMHCISRIRQALVDVDGFLHLRLNNWLTIIGSCTPSDSVLHALENLNVTQFCATLGPDPEFHSHFHKHYFNRDSFQSIMHWLWRFPSPPQQAIEFWERQLAAMETCRRSLIQDEQSGSEDSEDEDRSDEEEFDSDVDEEEDGLLPAS